MSLAVYQILNDDDRALREKAKAIPKINDAIFRLLDNLRDTLRETERGVGLAAPQIGVSKRAFIVDVPEEDIYFEMINPELSAMKGLEEAWEGCLSVNGVEGLIPRAQSVRVIYTDRENRRLELEADGYLARIIQHEYDHLEGLLFPDRALSVRDIVQKTEEDGPGRESG